MSALAIDNKVSRGFAKVARKLGYPFDLFRADSLIQPLTDRNRLRTIPLSWSKDEAFKVNPEPTLDYFILYCDYTVIAVGDILRSVQGDRTFLVSEINPFRGPVGVQCNQQMSILRTVYTPSADVKTSFQEVIKDMPCAFQHKGAASNDGALSVVASSMSSGQSQVEVWSVLDPESIKLNDVLEIGGLRYIITSLDSSSSGVKISAKSTKAGK